MPTGTRKLETERGYAAHKIVAHLMLRAGLPEWEAVRGEVADHYRDVPFREILMRACVMDGLPIVDGPVTEIFRTAIGGGTLGTALDMVAGGVLKKGYGEVEDTTRGWCDEVGAPNFKQIDRALVQGANDLPPVPRGKPAEEADINADAVESYKLCRFGRQFSLDDQDMLGDADFGVLRRVARHFGWAAKRRKLDTVFGLLLANAKMADGVPGFDAAHGNVSTGAALAAATLSDAVETFEIRTEDGVTQGLKAGYLLVPPALSHTAARLVREITAEGNVSLKVISEPRLQTGVRDAHTGELYAGSSTTWYLAARGAPKAVEIAYLDDNREPVVHRFNLDQGQWGVGWDVKFDIAAKILSYRSLHRATA